MRGQRPHPAVPDRHRAAGNSGSHPGGARPPETMDHRGHRRDNRARCSRPGSSRRARLQERGPAPARLAPMFGHDREALALWLEAARARWPEVTVDVADLARHLAALAIDTLPVPPHAADLVLACACARGDRAAVAVFAREMAPVMRSAARRIDDSADFADEVAQAAGERLLVARDQLPPRIAEYAGQGALAAWVRVAAMRIAMNLLRERRRNVLVDDEAFFDAATAGGDPEPAPPP